MTRIEQPAPLLRQTLMLDAAASGSMVLLLTAGAGLLAPLFGMPERFLLAVGIVLAPFAAGLAAAVAMARPPRLMVQAIIALNVLWVVKSIALLMIGWLQPTTLGVAFVIAQALAVAGFAAFEFIGFRQSGAAAEHRALA